MQQNFREKLSIFVPVWLTDSLNNFNNNRMNDDKVLDIAA